jgi:hypothetical protein
MTLAVWGKNAMAKLYQISTKRKRKERMLVFIYGRGRMRAVGDALAMLTAGMARTERFRSNRPDRRPRVVAVLDMVDKVFM